MGPDRLCVRFPLIFLICWSLVPFVGKFVFHLSIGPRWLSGWDSPGINVNVLRDELYSCCPGCWGHAKSEIWSRQNGRSSPDRSVSLHWLQIGFDYFTLHTKLSTLKIRWGESHFQQLQELEIYVLNSEVMSSVKSSSSMKSGGLCQLNSSGGYQQEAHPSTWFLLSPLLCTEVLTSTFCLYSRF